MVVRWCVVCVCVCVCVVCVVCVCVCVCVSTRTTCGCTAASLQNHQFTCKLLHVQAQMFWAVTQKHQQKLQSTCLLNSLDILEPVKRAHLELAKIVKVVQRRSLQTSVLWNVFRQFYKVNKTFFDARCVTRLSYPLSSARYPL